MKADKKEILRYLGYGKGVPDSKMEQLIEECIREVEKVATPKVVSGNFTLEQLEAHRLKLGGCPVTSKHLSKNLLDCEQVVFFAATLGIGVDKLIARYSKFEMSRVVVIQAVATALLEDFCDEQCTYLSEEWAKRGFYLRPRFSPGYGDFPIEFQMFLIGMLEGNKKLGIYLTDSFLMIPSKSVTAVIGLSRKTNRCEIKGCEVCEKSDCAYRRM